MDVRIVVASEDQKKTIPRKPEELGFGRNFTDHMFLMGFDPDEGGWHDPRVEPYHKLELDPATTVLHYAQEIFEGLKAYKGKDGGVFLFRHLDNLARLNSSAQRMVMPQLPLDVVERGLEELVKLDADWIPESHGCALYIRPTMIATDPFIGVRPSLTYLFYIIVGPVGAYYAEGFNPVAIEVAHDHVRAVRGGCGFAKTGGNYAASLAAQAQAKSRGYAQVLWLDAIERRWVEEVGTMNIWFRFADEIVTSPLTGSILPGVTRDSVLQLLRHRGEPVKERMISIDEVIEGARSGRLLEAFGTGTAAIISPVKTIAYQGEDVHIGDGATGPMAADLYETLLQLQYGYGDDPFGWRKRIA